jgi:hypothetical protein
MAFLNMEQQTWAFTFGILGIHSFMRRPSLPSFHSAALFPSGSHVLGSAESQTFSAGG